MTSIIHVDPIELRKAAYAISEMADSLSSIAHKLLYVTLGPRIYDGQLRCPATNMGHELRGLARVRVERLREMSALLERLADGFEAADQARLEGFVVIAGAMTALAQESLEVPAMPTWLRYGACPPWIDKRSWAKMVPEEYRSRIRELGEEYWAYLLRHSADMGGIDQDVLEEMLLIIMLAHLGRNIDGRVADYPMLGGDYGRGMIGVWEQYNGDLDSAQNINLYALLGFGPNAHYNLCGQLAVMASLGIPLEKGLLIFAEMWTSEKDDDDVWVRFKGEKILGNPGKTTFGYQLEEFFEAAGCSDAEWQYGEELSSDQVADMLNEGKALVALVNIDTFDNIGALKPLANGENVAVDPTAHWVTVLDVVEPPDGPTIVRVYNPFQNREEFYSWETFSQAWQSTEGNSIEYGLVVATP